MAVATQIRVVEGIDPGLVFKVRATQRITDEAFGTRGLAFLGETQDYTYFVFSHEDVPRRLLAQLGDYERGPDEEGSAAPGRSLFDLINAIEPYGPDDRRGPGIPEDPTSVTEALTVDVVVWPSPDAAEAQRRLRDVRVVVSEYDGEELAADERRQYTVLRTRISGDGVAALLGMAVVEQVNTPPTPFIEPSDWAARSADDLDVDIGDGEPVAVIDDGIADGHPLLQRVVASRRAFPATRTWGAIGTHGTMVGGLAAYGDFEVALRDNTALRAGGRLHQARVLEPDPGNPSNHRFPPEVTVHQAIEDAIQTVHSEEGVRVFNLSISQIDAYSGPHVSLVTERLDELIRELGVVVTACAGNHPVDLVTRTMASGDDVLTGYPAYTLAETARVAEPAPAALALTVGSIARADAPQTMGGVVRVGDQAVAAVNQLSPFSRTGPGAFTGVKPDVVDFGGNWVINDAGQLEWKNPGVSVISLAVGSRGQLFAVSTGTSFSAPRTARLAADVWTAYPAASANLVRALVGIAARVPPQIEAQYPTDDLRLRAVGYGRPDADLAVACGGSRVVMYFDGSMQTDTVAIHPIPIPEAFTRGQSRRRIAVSLAFDPPVRRQRREYLAGQLSFDLLRNVTPGEIAERYARQGEERVDLWTDRRRLDLKPGATRTRNSTLQVRCIYRSRLDPDDGETYYLAVKHKAAAWASGGQQSYALVVEIVDEEHTEVNLYNEVQQLMLPLRVEVPAAG